MIVREARRWVWGSIFVVSMASACAPYFRTVAVINGDDVDPPKINRVKLIVITDRKKDAKFAAALQNGQLPTEVKEALIRSGSKTGLIYRVAADQRTPDRSQNSAPVPRDGPLRPVARVAEDQSVNVIRATPPSPRSDGAIEPHYKCGKTSIGQPPPPPPPPDNVTYPGCPPLITGGRFEAVYFVVATDE